jgi:2-pyrone-4,6-dicarboxylate lactonase
VKLCPIRVSRAAPHYADARPLHDLLVERMPDRLVWGSDWPFLGLTGDARPTIAALLALFALWTPDAAVRRCILVDNPARLYGYEEIA